MSEQEYLAVCGACGFRQYERLWLLSIPSEVRVRCHRCGNAARLFPLSFIEEACRRVSFEADEEVNEEQA